MGKIEERRKGRGVLEIGLTGGRIGWIKVDEVSIGPEEVLF